MKRIEKVMDQLVMTNKSITDIAFESGFSTTKSLNQLFKKKLKMTPTEFRRQYFGCREAIASLDPVLKQQVEIRSNNYENALIKLNSHL